MILVTSLQNLRAENTAVSVENQYEPPLVPFNSTLYAGVVRLLIQICPGGTNGWRSYLMCPLKGMAG